jgi:hypothetical protein
MGAIEHTMDIGVPGSLLTSFSIFLAEPTRYRAESFLACGIFEMQNNVTA